jgi:hypothetical protein
MRVGLGTYVVKTDRKMVSFKTVNRPICPLLSTPKDSESGDPIVFTVGDTSFLTNPAAPVSF